jgi:hypothetical protein
VNDKNYDPIEAILILVGALIVGGSVFLGVVLSMASFIPHNHGAF